MREVLLNFFISSLPIALISSWIYFVLFYIHKKRNYKKLLKTLVRSKALIEKLKKELIQSKKQLERYTDTAEDTAEVALEVIDNALNQDIPLDALTDLNSSQSTLIQQLESLSDSSTTDDREKKQLKIHVARLKAQAQTTEAILERLKAEAEANRYRLEYLEEKLHKQHVELEKIEELKEKESGTRLKNSKLVQKIYQQTAELEKYQKLETKISSLQKIKNHLGYKVSKQEAELEKQQREIVLLKELRSNSSYDLGSDENSDTIAMQVIDEAKIAEFKQQIRLFEMELSERSGALERANREKELLEIQFLDLIDSIDKADDIKSELVRVKKEYSMLEDHFIRMHEEN